jgi:hypothetical protein
VLPKQLQDPPKGWGTKFDTQPSALHQPLKPASVPVHDVNGNINCQIVQRKTEGILARDIDGLFGSLKLLSDFNE